MTSEDGSLEIKLCVNCAFIATNGSGDWQKYKCMAGGNFSHINLVTGAKVYEIELCTDSRAWKGLNGCGKEGFWFQKKEVVARIEPPAFTGWTEKPLRESGSTGSSIRDAARARIGKINSL